MKTYLVVLTVHSYLRWAVLLLALIVLARSLRGWAGSREWTRVDDRFHAGLVGAIDLQLLLGLVLYIFLSPMTSAFFADVGAAMKEPALRFFGLEHIAAMVVAVTIFHIGRARSKKAKTPRVRHRRVWVSTLIALLLVAASIPWPFLRYGRPLLRF